MNPGYANNSRRTALVAALGLHALLIAALLTQAPVRSAIPTAAPIMVTRIPSAPVMTPQSPPKPLPIRPRSEPARAPLVEPLPIRSRSEPVHAPPIEPLPLMTTATDAPVPLVAPVPAVDRPRPIDAVPRSVESAPPPAAVAAVVGPRFNAAYLQNPPPVYPTLARRMGEQGRVLLRVLVTANGAADRVELRSTSGSERLDRAAINAVKRWRFVPARQGETSVAAWVLVPIAFSLEG